MSYLVSVESVIGGMLLAFLLGYIIGISGATIRKIESKFGKKDV